MCDEMAKLDALVRADLARQLEEVSQDLYGWALLLRDHDGRAWCLEEHITLNRDQWACSPCGHLGHAIFGHLVWMTLGDADSCDEQVGVATQPTDAMVGASQ
jgi:hypothetical protein